MFDLHESRLLTIGRDGHRCVRCGVYVRAGQWPGLSVHHRMNRLRADVEWRHSPANLVLLCGSGSTGCHGWVHQHPEQAHGLGLYLYAGETPQSTPVLDWRGDQWTPDDQGDRKYESKERKTLI